jgi:hypothetical protein
LCRARTPWRREDVELRLNWLPATANISAFVVTTSRVPHPSLASPNGRTVFMSVTLTIFWHCGLKHFLFRRAWSRHLAIIRQGFWPTIDRSQSAISQSGHRFCVQSRSNILKGRMILSPNHLHFGGSCARVWKMLSRSKNYGVEGRAADAARPAIPAASALTLLSGLLLLICP